MSDELRALGEAGAVLARWRAASIARSARDMEGLYTPDAVHEFPFTRPGLPSRLEGREAILSFVVASWDGPLVYERYETIAAHTTGDPDTVVVQQDIRGTSTATGPFALPNLVVLTAADGMIVHLRDFVNIPAAADAMGYAL